MSVDSYTCSISGQVIRVRREVVTVTVTARRPNGRGARLRTDASAPGPRRRHASFRRSYRLDALRVDPASPPRLLWCGRTPGAVLVPGHRRRCRRVHGSWTWVRWRTSRSPVSTSLSWSRCSVSVPVAEVSGAALVNGVAAWQQVVNMVQAAQAVWVRELEARTPDALRHVPDELACALVSTRRARGEPVPARVGRRAAPCTGGRLGRRGGRRAQGRRDPGRGPPRRREPVRGEVAAVVADAVDQAETMTGLS